MEKALSLPALNNLFAYPFAGEKNLCAGSGQIRVVTTSRRSAANDVILAKTAAQILLLAFVPRGESSLEQIAADFRSPFVVTATDGLLQIVEISTGEKLFFHPNMAHLRLKNLRLGLGDRFLSATGLEIGMSILDGTLGLGADSLIAAHCVGDAGRVVALEDNAAVAATVAHALQNFSTDNEPLRAAMRRIKVFAADHFEFLRRLPDNSFDVVYFDPMFRRPLKKSVALSPLRPLSDNRALTAATIASFSLSSSSSKKPLVLVVSMPREYAEL